MKAYVGIEIGAVACAVAATPQRGMIERQVAELPLDEPARSGAVLNSVHAALQRFRDRLPPCAAVGIAFSPPDTASLPALVRNDLASAALPYVADCRALFQGPEVGALFPHFGGGQTKAWLNLSDRARLYVEGAEYGDAPEQLSDEKGIARRISCACCDVALEPVRVLRKAIDFFASRDQDERRVELVELERLAALVQESAGVRFARRVDGMAILGLKSGVQTRRPQIARAALESVACFIRRALADLAGEGAVAELYISGPAARNGVLLEIIAAVCGVTVVRSEISDAVAYGAAMRAAQEDGEPLPRPERKRFNPTMPASQREELYARWLAAGE